MAIPKTTASVRLWGDTVGAVTWLEDDQIAVFEFEKSFLKKGLDIAPLTMSLDDALRSDDPSFSFPNLSITFNGLPGLLANSLPDKWGDRIINAWLTSIGRDVSSFDPVERLCYTGTRGMGALEYHPESHPKNFKKPFQVDVEQMHQVAQMILDHRSALNVEISDSDKENYEAITTLLKIGTSAGGARPKAIIAMNDEGHIISGQTDTPDGYSHYILKFDGVSEDGENIEGPNGSGRLEYAYYLMARAAGIDMMECRLLEENGRAHFITKRFDRIGNEKLHTQTLCCLSHIDWNPAGQHGYERAFMEMRRLGLGKEAQNEQYRRMIFNALTRNMDDHVRNVSFLMDQKGQWSLSPAYDLTFSYNPDGKFANGHQMSINGRRTDFVLDDFLDVASTVEIDHPEDIIEEVQDTVSQWSHFADEAGVAPEGAQAIESFFLKDLDSPGMRM